MTDPNCEMCAGTGEDFGGFCGCSEPPFKGETAVVFIEQAIAKWRRGNSLFVELRGSVGRILDLHPREPTIVLSEGQLHAAEVEHLDETQPGWDESARIARAEYSLRSKVDYSTVVRIYGPDVAEKARLRLSYCGSGDDKK